MTPADQFAAKRTEAESLIQKHAPARLQSQLIALLRPAIALTATRTDDAHIPLGTSKFGGAPDVPLEFEWPMWNKKPLGFLAQINLEEVAPFDVENQLLKSGVLLFFAMFDEENPLWGDPAQREGWRVVLALELLHRFEPPTTVNWAATQRIAFAPAWTLDQTEIDDPELEPDWEEEASMNFKWEVLAHPPHRMLSSAYAPQLSPLVFAANGSAGKSGYALYDETSATDEWQLLLQVDTGAEFFNSAREWGWLYFLVRRNDLQSGNFSNVWFDTQGT